MMVCSGAGNDYLDAFFAELPNINLYTIHRGNSDHVKISTVDYQKIAVGRG